MIGFKNLCQAILTSAVALCMTDCDKNIAWTETVSLPVKGWTQSQPIVFNLDPEAYKPEVNKYEYMTSKAIGDTIPRLKGIFQAHLSLRYKDDCNASDMKIVVERAALDTEITRDTIAIRFFDNDGAAEGHGRFGLNETSIPLNSPLIVSDGTTITVLPIDYKTPVTGLLSLTLTLKH